MTQKYFKLKSAVINKNQRIAPCGVKVIHIYILKTKFSDKHCNMFFVSTKINKGLFNWITAFSWFIGSGYYHFWTIFYTLHNFLFNTSKGIVARLSRSSTAGCRNQSTIIK